MAPSLRTPAGLAALHRSVGNRAVGRLLGARGQRRLQRTIEVEGKVYTDPEEVKKFLAGKRERNNTTTYLTYATHEQPEGKIDQALAEINAHDEVFDTSWSLVERIQDYKPPAASSSDATASSPPLSDNPLAKLGFDWLFVHFLFPDAHHEEGPVRKETIEFISFAQTSSRFSGRRMLTVYYHVLDYLAKHGVGDAKLQQRLQSEVGRGSGEEEASGDPSVLSFAYGGHHAYARVGRVPDSRRYRLEYFDRQRQTLELRGRKVPGYTLEAGGRPMWFEFDVPSLEQMMVIYEKAQKLAVSEDGGTSGQDGPRQAVLEYFAAEAADFGLVAGESEPMQHPRAVNCQWASLESVIRASLGATLLETHLEEMRKWVTDYAKRADSSRESKRAVGISDA